VTKRHGIGSRRFPCRPKRLFKCFELVRQRRARLIGPAIASKRRPP
jgi:hypothetical protein